MSFSPTPRLNSSYLFVSHDETVLDIIFRILEFYNPTLRSNLNTDVDIAKKELYDTFIKISMFQNCLNENNVLIANIYCIFKKILRTENETVILAYKALYQKFIKRNKLLNNEYDILAILFFSNENYSKEVENLCIAMKLAGEWN